MKTLFGVNALSLYSHASTSFTGPPLRKEVAVGKTKIIKPTITVHDMTLQPKRVANIRMPLGACQGFNLKVTRIELNSAYLKLSKLAGPVSIRIIGYGILVAGEISRRLGLLKDAEFEKLRAAIQLCGPLPRVDDLQPQAIIKALRGDKKNVGG